MVSLLFLSLVGFELFAAVSATKPLLQRTPRRYSPIKHQLDSRLSGLLVFGRQNSRGPCCSNGGCCDSGEFCNGDSCCFNSEVACTAAEGGGCCLSGNVCEVDGCCPIGEFCSGPPAGTITLSSLPGGGGGGGGFTPSDTSFPSVTFGFSSSSHHSSSSILGGGFGTTPFPTVGSITGGLGTTPIATISTPSLGGGGISSSLSASAGGGGALASAASRAVVGPYSVLIPAAMLSLSAYYL